MCISSQQKQASMFAALVAAFFILSGCWQPRVKNVDEQTRKGQSQQPVATFFVEKAGGSSRPGLITEWEPSLASAVDGSLKMAAQERRTLWEIPEYKFITFYACVKSTANQQPLRTQKFVVSNSSMEFDVQSDERGCFTWTEPYLYSIYNDPKYLREKRTIKNVGNAPGELDVEFAINPWLLDRGGRGQDEVVFLKDQNLPQGLISDTPVVSMMSESKQLWMNDLQAHIINNSEALQHEASSDEDFHLQSKSMGIGGIDIEMNLEMRPVVMLKGMDGRTKSESIGAGRFRVYAYLVATGMGDCRCERMILTPGAPPAIGEVLAADGKLRVPIKARMAYWAVGSNVEVAIRVEAVDTPPTVALKSYEGIYKLGSIDRLEGGARPFLSEVTYDANKRASFNFDRYLSEATNSVKALKEAREAFNLEPYIFKTMDVRFQTIRTGETATTRTVMFRVKTCIVDSLTGRPVRNEGFFIERIRYQAPGLMVQPDPDPRVLPRETDDEGCLTWMDEHVHKYYKPEQYVFPKAIITNQSAQRRSRNEPGKAFSKTLTIVVNPWDEKWTFGADERALLPDYVESIQKREKTPSRFLLYEFTYQTIRFLYDIDEFMNLQVKKTVLLKLYPKALRYSSIVNGRRATEPLRDGIYLMKVAMQKDYLDPASKGIQIVREGNGTHEYVADPDVNTDETQVGDSQDRYTTKTGAQVKVKEHISVVQKLVRVQDGHIITPVELSMRDLRLMKIRSQFLIQLETIDEARLLMANVFNEITNKKIDQFMDQMKEDSPDRKAFDECLIQKTPDFKDQLLAVMDELKTFREAPADVKKTLMREKRAVLSELIKSLRMHPANREVWSEDKSKLLEKQKESKLLGEPLIDENKLNEHYQSLYICDDILAETIKSLTLNDFTVNPAAPVIDLKSLIDFDSGLDRRTFVGPITLIHNSNHSHMRPTDNLDEIFCESGNDGCNELEFDPDQIDNSVYEDSELFGSIRHLVDKNVDDLIERKKQMVKDYYRTMTIESLLYNFLDFTNTKFVSLGGEHLKKYTCGPLSKENLKDLNLSACLKKTDENTVKAEALVEKLNSFKTKTSEVGRGDLENLVENLELSPAMGDRICQYFADQIVDDNIGLVKKDKWDFFNTVPRWLRNEFKFQCQLRRDSSKSPFSITRRYRVERTGRYKFKGGKSMNINVGSSFSVSHDSSYGSNLSGGLPAFLGLDRLFGARVGWTRSERRSHGDGVSVSAQTFLVTQMAALDVELLRYEKCVTLRWNDQFVEDSPQGRRLIQQLEASGTRNDFKKPGLFICSGKIIDDRPLPVDERYYYFTQHFTDGDMLDPGDLYNHPWLLALRGVRDFRAFIALINQTSSSLFTLDNLLGADPTFASEEWPIDKLSDVYKSVLPSFPGLYTAIGEGRNDFGHPEYFNYPWNNLPVDSFADESFKNSWDLVPRSNY